MQMLYKLMGAVLCAVAFALGTAMLLGAGTALYLLAQCVLVGRTIDHASVERIGVAWSIIPPAVGAIAFTFRVVRMFSRRRGASRL